MSLDLSFSNLFLENIGATIDNLLNLTNLIVVDTNAFNFNNLSRLVNILNLWPTEAQFDNAMNTVLFIVYTNDNYLDTVREVYEALPYLYALDYLHLFYLKQVVYKCYLSHYAAQNLMSAKPVVFSLQLDFFFSYFTNK